MPGYAPLSAALTGATAESTRVAETHLRDGKLDEAARFLEAALDASLAMDDELPGWLCGRLAAVYRSLGRLDDEVRLLERFRESQRSEETRTRYDARLCKARTLAERKRKSECGALSSVRTAMNAPRRRRRS